MDVHQRAARGSAHRVRPRSRRELRARSGTPRASCSSQATVCRTTITCTFAPRARPKRRSSGAKEADLTGPGSRPSPTFAPPESDDSLAIALFSPIEIEAQSDKGGPSSSFRRRPRARGGSTPRERTMRRTTSRRVRPAAIDSESRSSRATRSTFAPLRRTRPFDLVYIDPPFNVGGAFAARTKQGEARGRQTRTSGPRAYEDAWGGRDGFLAMLGPRLSAIRERMSSRATLYLHLDHRTVHDAKVAVRRDLRPRAPSGARSSGRPATAGPRARGPTVTHQTLLVFSASPRSPAIRSSGTRTIRAARAVRADEPRHALQTTDADGRAFRERTIGGKTYRYFADEGRRLGSVWTDIPAMVANTPLRKEGTGYPTQKPEKLARAHRARGERAGRCGRRFSCAGAARRWSWRRAWGDCSSAPTPARSPSRRPPSGWIASRSGSSWAVLERWRSFGYGVNEIA